MDRRTYLKVLGRSSLAFALSPGFGAFQYRDRRSFFTVGNRNGHWYFITPKGKPFWSIGLNHVDPATLRYADSEGVWEGRYDNSMKKWLRQVRRDLREWGFNTLGWNQEVVTINDQNHRHSRSFTLEEYQWLDMPYCHLLPFIESHQWEIETRLPDIRSKGFAEWCDYVARDQCARMKDDPNLIGYFFTDCPTWVHTRGGTEWKAPIFDPDLLKTESGKKELFDLATTYYRTIVEAIRRYDFNHLILGDRYEGNSPLPEEVVRAALPYVDVLSFQCFGNADRVQRHLSRWARFAGKPVLLADNAPWIKPENAQPGWPPKEDWHIDSVEYGRIVRALWEIPGCVGYHLCGAYLQNKVRRYGLKDRRDRLDSSTIRVKAVNEEMRENIGRFAGK